MQPGAPGQPEQQRLGLVTCSMGRCNAVYPLCQQLPEAGVAETARPVLPGMGRHRANLSRAENPQRQTQPGAGLPDKSFVPVGCLPRRPWLTWQTVSACRFLPVQQQAQQRHAVGPARDGGVNGFAAANGAAAPSPAQNARTAAKFRIVVSSAFEVHIHKAGVGAIPAQRHRAGLTMAVLCHDALGGIGIHLRAVRVLAGVVGITVEEQDAVGVLLDGTGVTQVGQLGAVEELLPCFSTARDSWLSAMMGTFISLAMILRFRVMELISCTRFSLRWPVVISCR